MPHCLLVVLEEPDVRPDEIQILGGLVEFDTDNVLPTLVLLKTVEPFVGRGRFGRGRVGRFFHCVPAIANSRRALFQGVNLINLLPQAAALQPFIHYVKFRLRFR